MNEITSATPFPIVEQPHAEPVPMVPSQTYDRLTAAHDALIAAGYVRNNRGKYWQFDNSRVKVVRLGDEPPFRFIHVKA